jgi:hypothetical protein
MITFGELLEKYPNNEILATLFKEYPEQEENLFGYIEALSELRSLEPQTPDYVISITSFSADDDPLSEIDWVDVSGVKHNDSTNYAIEYEPFERWLGAPISEQSFIDFDEPQVLAHCMFEITWSGYSNAERQEQLDCIMDVYNDALDQMN